MAAVKAWKLTDTAQPDFPAEFDIVKRAVLQVTDIKNNNNKYYGLELQSAPKVSAFRVFTHYGRTDDLQRDPNAGAKESRYFSALADAQHEYDRIYKEKTAASKGYKEVALASSKIGSQQARGQTSGNIDQKTLSKAKATNAAPTAPSTLEAGLQDLVRYLYAEATAALTSTVAATITANGIETPLGTLTVGQVEKGEAVLADIQALIKQKAARSAFEVLSGDFYTAIPHRIGRTREAIASAVIDSLADVVAKQETLQLMKDMLAVNGDGGSVLFDDNVDNKYRALGCQVQQLAPSAPDYAEWHDFVLKSQLKTKNIKVVGIYTVKRGGEFEAFDTSVGNEKMMFHGSRIKNWVGLLSRGILMPKAAMSMGVNRTDAGWLGNGIYFGDVSCTSAFYTTAGDKGTRFMAVARVGLGEVKEYTKITYGLDSPPPGYQSCRGVRSRPGLPSQFADDEYVVYRQNQQRLEYLVEFKM